MFQKILGLLCCLCLTIGSTGCHSTPTATQDSVVRLATQSAIIRYAEKFTPDVRAEKLGTARRILLEVKMFTSGEAVTIPTLSLIAKQEIAKSTASPADQYLAAALVDAVATEFQSRYGKGMLRPEDMARVSDLLQWVADAIVLTEG